MSTPGTRSRTIGVLALQGDVAEHRRMLEGLGVLARTVRVPRDLDDVDALVLPGGESTTLSMLLDSSGLRPVIAGRIAAGMPVFGTCAGMILLATRVVDGRPDQQSFAAIDVTVRRNAFGRQLDSFETDLDVSGLDRPLHAVFIRAPAIEAVGEGVEVLASVEVNGSERIVAARQGNVLVTSFHPELAGDDRLHQMLLDLVEPQAAAPSASSAT